MPDALPTTDEQRERAEAELARYIDELEAHIEIIRCTGQVLYEYAISAAQCAIRMSAQVRAVTDITGNDWARFSETE